MHIGTIFAYFCKQTLSLSYLMNFILFDEPTIKNNLLPLTYFRPVSEIRCGILTIKEKWEYYLKQTISYLSDTYLQEKYPARYTETNVYINARIFPSQALVDSIRKMKIGEALVFQDELIAVKAEQISLQDLQKPTFKQISLNEQPDGIYNTYDIFSKNGEQIQQDFPLLTQDSSSETLSPTNTIIGKHPVFVSKGVKVEACIINTEDGPVYIGENAKILEGSMIRGPFAMLENSVVKMGAKIYQGTTLGPWTTVGGEIKGCVFFGYANKGHDGYLGDSVIAEWCNLGADTNNSNLKNNYSEVKLWNYSQKDFTPTGLQFCGLIMGDHSKCGIATMFNTGTVVGVSSNVFGGDYQPKFFPSFKWGNTLQTDYRYEKALEVARIVIERRNKDFNETEQRLFKAVYDISKQKEK